MKIEDQTQLWLAELEYIEWSFAELAPSAKLCKQLYDWVVSVEERAHALCASLKLAGKQAGPEYRQDRLVALIALVWAKAKDLAERGMYV